jgi:hypothetical protein
VNNQFLRFRQCLDQFETSMFIQDSFAVTVAGVRTNWELRVYPNGYDDENANYLGIFVKHKEGNSHQYMIKSVIQVRPAPRGTRPPQMLDAAGDRQVPVELPGKVLSSKQMHGTKKYIERETLMQNQQLYSEDSITFLLEAEIVQPGTRVSAAGQPGLELEGTEPGHLARDLTRLLRGGQHRHAPAFTVVTISTIIAIIMLTISDMRLVAGGRSFPCHSVLLAARSEQDGGGITCTCTTCICTCTGVRCSPPCSPMTHWRPGRARCRQGSVHCAP